MPDANISATLYDGQLELLFECPGVPERVGATGGDNGAERPADEETAAIRRGEECHGAAGGAEMNKIDLLEALTEHGEVPDGRA